MKNNLEAYNKAIKELQKKLGLSYKEAVELYKSKQKPKQAKPTKPTTKKKPKSKRKPKPTKNRLWKLSDWILAVKKYGLDRAEYAKSIVGNDTTKILAYLAGNTIVVDFPDTPNSPDVGNEALDSLTGLIENAWTIYRAQKYKRPFFTVALQFDKFGQKSTFGGFYEFTKNDLNAVISAINAYSVQIGQELTELKKTHYSKVKNGDDSTIGRYEDLVNMLNGDDIEVFIYETNVLINGNFVMVGGAKLRYIYQIYIILP